MAARGRTETYRGTLITAFGVQAVHLLVRWRRRRHLTEIGLELSIEGELDGDITAEVSLAPCTVHRTDAALARAADGGASLLIQAHPGAAARRTRVKAVVSNVGPSISPVVGVSIEGRSVAVSRAWVSTRTAALAAAMCAAALAVGVGAVLPRLGGRTASATVQVLAGSADATTSPTAEVVATATTTTTTTNTTASTDGGADAPGREAALLARVTPAAANWLVISRIDLVSPIVHGVEDSDLARGVGRYTRTAAVGAPGNLGLAGHRTTSPAPFRHLDAMEVGDPILVVTRTEILRYQVEEAAPGRATIEVTPDSVSVLGSRGHDGLTLTTCTPVGTTTRRLVVYARLVSREPR